jgi:hypothetical protein
MFEVKLEVDILLNAKLQINRRFSSYFFINTYSDINAFRLIISSNKLHFGTSIQIQTE